MTSTKKHSKKYGSFHIVRNAKEPMSAMVYGKSVHREEKILVLEWGRFVMCAPYDDHFIFETPVNHKGEPTYQCTCGSAAVIVGANVYQKDSSPTNSGELLVCLNHATYGVHATGGSRWI